MQNLLLDFSSDEIQKGYRLYRLEVYNWGTFDKKIWKIEPLGFNSLLTGDIGSGKSTLVDAILTLLVPHQKIVYNKAAGAETRERTLTSYVRGEYKNQRSDFSNSSPVYLRGENDYSVLLARFYNKGFESGYTLAQVFWIRNGSPEKFFIISKQDLNIKEHFNLKPDDRDIFALKKRLKAMDQVEVFEAFKDYSSKFRSYFGIRSEKVLELFYQTVSMKSVGKLTEFMRNHMLEKLDVKDKIEEIKRNYENLTKSYEAVQRAKQQLEQLTPLISDIVDYEKIHSDNTQLKKSIEFTPIYFAELKTDILKKELDTLGINKKCIEDEIAARTTLLETLDKQKEDIIVALNQNKEGQRISQLENEIKILERDKETKFQVFQKYAKLCEELGVSREPDENQFQQSLHQAEVLEKTLESELGTLETQKDQVSLEYMKLRNQYELDKNELDSLQKRKTKIPEKNMQIRELILSELGLLETDLPFVGELLQIKLGERDWEGAIERVLHNFGLSILVAERYYREVSYFVDKTNLKGRIVYYKILNTKVNANLNEIEKTHLINKVDIIQDSEFYDWITNELCEHYDYTCCETIEQFQREVKAITKNGQIKGSRGRHEKDDRLNLHDQRNYILGWNNQEKINNINNALNVLDKQIKNTQSQQDTIKKQLKLIDTRKFTIHDFLNIKSYNEINWKTVAQTIEKDKQEILELEKTSDQLKALKRTKELKEFEIRNTNKAKSELENQLGITKSNIIRYTEELIRCNQIISNHPIEQYNDILPIITSHSSGEIPNIKNIDNYQENTVKRLKKELDEKSKTEETLHNRIVSNMLKFKQNYAEDTVEMVTSIEAIQEYKKFYEKLKIEDLPRYEERFKKMLNEGTIHDIAMFKSQLDANAKQIEKNIRVINDSLKTIEYSKGTYIELLSERIIDVEIKTFQTDLRDCLEGTFGEKNPYSENKFNQVKKILDRFNSGSQADINWTNKVTDVRNWYQFSAVERYQFDNTEKEFYSDSSGKSGGQKEKLAYTILASALAYQFGSAGDTPKSKSFRFVMIDEAFGRGSDESTRYGMDLFKKLDLQLLIITPLQKIHIIENYINCVHLVSNTEGNDSKTRDIPIQEYLEEKTIQAVSGEINDTA